MLSVSFYVMLKTMEILFNPVIISVILLCLLCLAKINNDSIYVTNCGEYKDIKYEDGTKIKSKFLLNHIPLYIKSLTDDEFIESNGFVPIPLKITGIFSFIFNVKDCIFIIFI